MTVSTNHNTNKDRRHEERIVERLARLYESQQVADLAPRLLNRCVAYRDRLNWHVPDSPWDETDTVLITYGDQFRRDGEPPLATFQCFAADNQLSEIFSTVHFLPFFPYSSDDGFSVIDYRKIDPELGNWDDVDRISQQLRLMFDLVLNHCSSESAWAAGFRRGETPYDRYFVVASPDADLSQVTRPRSLPLLTPVETTKGTRHVWTTFSADQWDLDFGNPELLLEMVDVLLGYIVHGARIIRLDAIAYLWKRRGTPCIHLPETHQVVKLLRDIVEWVAPGVLLLTETNVPHRENVSYFGEGDEAHMVYQFSLPPLLLDALLNEDATPLARWLADLEPPRSGTTYFNFTASHDGVGVRPLESLVDDTRRDALVDAVLRRGGRVSTRRREDGADVPYELNITYLSALADVGRREEGSGGGGAELERFLCSQAIMLSLQGIPGVYVHSLLGTENDERAVVETGIARRINRRKFSWAEAAEITAAGATSLAAQVYQRYRRLLAVRRAQPAFHPDAAQVVLPGKLPRVIALVRENERAAQRILVVANVSGQSESVRLDDLIGAASATDLIGGKQWRAGEDCVVAPFQVQWWNCQ